MLAKEAWVSCNICGGNAFEELSLVDKWHIGRCGSCSLIYLNPMPFFAPSAEFSAMSMGFQYTQFQHKLTASVLEHDSKQVRGQFSRLAQLGGPAVKTGRFLDVGCGSGASVRAAHDLGWEAVGVDIDPSLVELGREELQVDLRCSPLLEAGLEANQFHFIRLRDVIEHLPNPSEVLREVSRLLCPGGVVLIATPNEEGLLNEARHFLGVRRTTVATVAPPHHVHGFTPKTLDLILKKVGFEVLQVKTTTPVDPLYATARQMEHDGKPHVAVWRLAKLLGRGSMLVGWGRKPNLNA